jgi:hypothetical protein
MNGACGFFLATSLFLHHTDYMPGLAHRLKSLFTKVFRTCLPIATFVLPFVVGCSTYKGKQEAFNRCWSAGQLDAAYSDISKRSSSAPKHDKLIYQLEEGTVLQSLGRFDESAKIFKAAEENVRIESEKANVRVGQEVGGAFVNQSIRTYEPTAYDRIMLKTYLALGKLAMGDVEGMSTDLLGAHDYQKMAVEENARKIEKAVEEAKEKKVDVDRVLADDKVQGQMAIVKNSCQGTEAFKDYVNPFTTLLFTLDLIYHKKDTGNAENFIKRLQDMVPNHPSFAPEMQQVTNLREGKSLSATTYLVVETGRAPFRDQIRIDLPLFIATSKVPYVGAAFPYLKYNADFVADFTLQGGGNSAPAVLLADFDGIIRTDFKNQLPAIITRTIVSTTVKAAASYAINEQTGIFGAIGTTIYQIAVNIADTRSWTTLPKQVQVSSIPTPIDGKIKISSVVGHIEKEIQLKGGTLQIVWVRSISPGVPITVTTLAIP